MNFYMHGYVSILVMNILEKLYACMDKSEGGVKKIMEQSIKKR
jgi:hypothetical protein